MAVCWTQLTCLVSKEVEVSPNYKEDICIYFNSVIVYPIYTISSIFLEQGLSVQMTSPRVDWMIHVANCGVVSSVKCFI